MATQPSNKRLKSSCNPSSIHDLPDETLGKVADYLPKISRALFAMSMTRAPLSAWREGDSNQILLPSSKAVVKAILYPPSRSQDDISDQRISEQWEKLDFSDIENYLAAKLSDDDIGGILVCINASNTLRILKLCGCVNMTGTGLEPLRGSTVLEQIDLSLAGLHRSPVIEPEPLISEEVVLPIFTSVVENASSSIKHIQLPLSWRNKRRISSILKNFLRVYQQILDRRNPTCFKCSLECREFYCNSISRDSGDYYGLQNFTCTICMENFCENFGCNALNTCKKCLYRCCNDCVAMAGCPYCAEQLCLQCGELIECKLCGEWVCQECIKYCEHCKEIGCGDCVRLDKCENEGCDKANCKDCYDADTINVISCDEDVHMCDAIYSDCRGGTGVYCGCGVKLCFDCRWEKCSEDWDGACPGCLQIVSRKKIPKLLEENKKLQEEIGKLRQEKKKLRKK